MQVRGLVWLGTATPEFEATARFFGEVLGLPSVVDEPGLVAFQLPDSSLVEVFTPDSRYAEHHDGRPVVGFLVDDVPAASAELAAAGIELVGGMELSEDYAWQYFRAPDRNLYEITSGPYRR